MCGCGISSCEGGDGFPGRGPQQTCPDGGECDVCPPDACSNSGWFGGGGFGGFGGGGVGPVRPFSAGHLLTVMMHVLAWLDSSALRSIVDVRLDHWWLSRREHGVGAWQRLLAALLWQRSVGQSDDNAAFEVRPSSAARLNACTPPHPTTFYISFMAPRSVAASLSRMRAADLAAVKVAEEEAEAEAEAEAESHRPIAIVFTRITTALITALSRLQALMMALARELAVLLFSFSLRLGSSGRRAAAVLSDGFQPTDWVADDGLLSIVGQRCPFNQPWAPLPPTLLLAHDDAHDDALDEKEDEKEDDEHVALTPTTARVLSLGPRIAESNSTGGGAVASVADTFLATALPEMGSFAGAARKAAEKRQPGRTGAHDGCVLTPGLWYVHELEMVEARSSATAACKCSPRRPLLPTQVRARARDGRSLRRVRRPTLEPAERGGVLGCVHAAPGAATR